MTANGWLNPGLDFLPQASIAVEYAEPGQGLGGASPLIAGFGWCEGRIGRSFAVRSITLTKKTTKPRNIKATTKSQQIVNLLSRQNGASIAELIKATSWQAHSVRGFMAGTLKKKGVEVTSTREDDKDRRYRILEKA